jgi:hypothetical protein
MSFLSILKAVAQLSLAVVWRLLTGLWALIRVNPWRALAVAFLLACAWVCHLLAGARDDRDFAKVNWKLRSACVTVIAHATRPRVRQRSRGGRPRSSWAEQVSTICGEGRQ